MLIPFVLIATATVGYPFIVYSSLDYWGPANLAWLLLALLVARVLMRNDFKQPEQYMQLLLVGSLCLVAALFDSEQLLRYYPVAMSIAFGAFFLVSLRTDKSLIERFAGLGGTDYSAHQQYYMRNLTKIWAALLILNALVASYTACCMSLKAWTLYNGALAYVIFGVFSLGELIFRYFYKLRHLDSN
jgi:uncharacterized membrane protein